MDKVRSAAIVLLGVGEKCANEILKAMTPKEVSAIVEAIDHIGSVSESEMMEALDSFFSETNSTSIDLTSRDKIKSSLLSAMGNKKIDSIIHGVNNEKDQWLELIKIQPIQSILEIIKDEHPQIITAIVIVIFNNISSDYGIRLIKMLPKTTQSQVFQRMTQISSITYFALQSMSNFFHKELVDTERNNVFSINGLDAVANIISSLDSTTEHEIVQQLTQDNKELGERIQEKIFPFHRLTEIDKRSFQTLLSEISNDDMLLALKGVDDRVRQMFLNNMSAKAAEILKDDMDTKGPVKVSQVLDAQKNILRLAKKLDEEKKIMLVTKGNPDVIF